MLAITTIYQQYKQDVFGYLMSLTHDRTLSEDLVSETFLGAMISINNFKGQSDIKTWLFSIARHKWYEHLRKRREVLSFDQMAEQYVAKEGDPVSLIAQKDMAEKILGYLDGEKDRDIVLMRIEGYSFYEIGQKYEISESSARVLDFRLKKKIRTRLEKEGLTDESFNL